VYLIGFLVYIATNKNDMWQEVDDKLYSKFIFSDFSEAFSFMTRVAMLAEKADHHPTWTNTWNTVEVWLSTHDAGNKVTAKDHNLALAIGKLLK
jgi:4a-hydroxytetrahydrobiopterin dehydratase